MRDTTAAPTVENRLAQIRERRIKAGRGGWCSTDDPAWGSDAQVWGADGDPIADVYTSFTPHPDAGDEVCAEAGDIALFIASAHADVGALLDAVEAALRVADNFGLPLGAEGRDDFAAGAAAALGTAKEQIYDAVTKAVTGRIEAGAGRG